MCCMRRAVLILLSSFVALSGAPKLHLKNRTIDPTASQSNVRVKSSHLRTGTTAKVHLLVQFDHQPDAADVAALDERGVTITSYVHENGLVVSCNDITSLEGLGLTWVSMLEVADKLSPLLPGNGGPAVFEFHADININDARHLIADLGLKQIDNPDLAPHHLLADGSADQILAAAARDEVDYVFPASDALRAGQPVFPCTGAVTALGNAAQYTAVAGDGWDGPGKGSATLGYHFSATTAQLSDAQVRSEVLRAFAEWSRYVKVTLTPADSTTAQHTVNVLFGHGDHGDPYPFDGPGGALAHTFYPAPPNPEPIAGDMHFDDDEHWQVGADIDLFAVALHEMGHALGLGHSDKPGSVMYPYYSRAQTLTAEDIAAIQQLYAAQDGDQDPAWPTEPTQPDQPAQPSTPSNPDPDPDPTPSAPTPQPVTLSVNLPPSVVTAESVMLVGNASGGTGTITVRWATDRGHSGLAVGSQSWVAQVLLETGANTVTLTAVDSQQVSASKIVSITRQVAATPVNLQITDPVGGAFSTSQAVIHIRGTASHSSGIRQVTWSTDRGSSGTAQGSISWDTGNIPLQPGANNVTIRAVAVDGRVATRAVPVTRGGGVRDITAPTLAITNPALSSYTTSADSVVVKGTAFDNVGVVQVTWFSSNSDSGTAIGTTSWQTQPVPLIQGFNSIVVRAFDAAGNMAWRIVNVTRR